MVIKILTILGIKCQKDNDDDLFNSYIYQLSSIEKITASMI